jgi:hypothetical protein
MRAFIEITMPSRIRPPELTALGDISARVRRSDAAKVLPWPSVSNKFKRFIEPR